MIQIASEIPEPSAPKSRSAAKKVLFSLVVCTSCLLITEAIARFATAETAATYTRHRQLISVMGLPALNDIMEYDDDRFWRLKDNLTEHRVAGLVGTNQVDFTVSTHNHLRSPLPRSHATRYRILTLGDSCTFGLGVDDAQTWPAQLQQLLNADGDRVEVINAGVPGYSSFQGRRFLEKEGLHLAPDLVIAGFGFNDREVWASRSDYETAHAFSDAGYDYWLTDSRAYSCLKTWWHRSKAPAGGRRVPRLNLQEFQATLVAMRDMCAANEIEFATIVWPYEPQVRLGSADREKYQLAVTTLDRTQDIPVISLIEPFIASPTSLFLDHIHANADGCRMAAEEVAEFVSARLP